MIVPASAWTRRRLSDWGLTAAQTGVPPLDASVIASRPPLTPTATVIGPARPRSSPASATETGPASLADAAQESGRGDGAVALPGRDRNRHAAVWVGGVQRREELHGDAAQRLRRQRARNRRAVGGRHRAAASGHRLE